MHTSILDGSSAEDHGTEAKLWCPTAVPDESLFVWPKESFLPVYSSNYTDCQYLSFRFFLCVFLKFGYCKPSTTWTTFMNRMGNCFATPSLNDETTHAWHKRYKTTWGFFAVEAIQSGAPNAERKSRCPRFRISEQQSREDTELVKYTEDVEGPNKYSNENPKPRALTVILTEEINTQRSHIFLVVMPHNICVWQITMTTGWLLLLMLIVSSQSVDSQSTTDDETCGDGELLSCLLYTSPSPRD